MRTIKIDTTEEDRERNGAGHIVDRVVIVQVIRANVCHPQQERWSENDRITCVESAPGRWEAHGLLQCGFCGERFGPLAYEVLTNPSPVEVAAAELQVQHEAAQALLRRMREAIDEVAGWLLAAASSDAWRDRTEDEGDRDVEDRLRYVPGVVVCGYGSEYPGVWVERGQLKGWTWDPTDPDGQESLTFTYGA